MEEYIEIAKGYAIQFAPKLISAILILLIGFWIINRLVRWADNAMNKGSLDVSLQKFLHSLMNIGLKVILIVTAAGMLGMQTTSLVAILGAASLAVGLALQGSLANFAGGVLVLIFKPYKVGDLIDAQGQFGEVQEIQTFNTIILTLDKKTVIIPKHAPQGQDLPILRDDSSLPPYKCPLLFEYLKHRKSRLLRPRVERPFAKHV
jgi:small conductance mechanosensitive channel